MDIGKIPNKILKELVLNRLKTDNKRILLPAGIGEDFGAIDFGDEYCVVSGDPITGAVKMAGKTSVYVACNDIATCGVKPFAILTTILLPPGATEAELGALVAEIAETADSLGVVVIGGHTEVTDAVTRTVISVTAIGAVKRGKLISTGGALAGDALVMTKSAAIEGAAIIASERGDELKERFGDKFIEDAARLSDDMSVVEDGVVAGEFGVHAMHDATEGGVFGAAWEIAEASGKGIALYQDKITVCDAACKICDFYNLDAYRLISSGCMLMATDKPGDLIAALSRFGIVAKEIGVFLQSKKDRYVFKYGDGADDSIKTGKLRLEPPGPDELYKIYAR